MSSQPLSHAEAVARLKEYGFIPLEPYKSNKSPWNVKHKKCGAIVHVRLGNLKLNKGACSSCRNSTIGYSHKEAIAIMKKANLKPDVPFVNSQTRWDSHCLKCGSKCSPKLSWIVAGQGGCIPCGYANRKNNRKGDTQGSTKRKSKDEAIKIFKMYGRTPLEPYPELSTKPWKSKCNKCGLVGSPTLSTVLKRQNSQCRDCGSERSATAKRLTQAQVKRRFKDKKLELLEPYKFDNTELLKTKCILCGRKLEQSLLGIAKNNLGCKTCAGVYVDPAEATKFMRNRGYEPQEPYKGTDTPWACIHVICGKPCKPRYGTIKRGEGGCKHCAEWGYSTSLPSYIYFIKHSEWSSLKVGIGNVGKSKKVDRLNRHLREGWELIEVWNFDTGSIPMAVETEFFRDLRLKKKVPSHLKRGTMKYQGETETFEVGSVREKTVVKFIESAIARRGIG